MFRPTTPKGGIQDSPLYLVEARLKFYLKEMNMDEGETLHGFRAGCAIMLALTGADLVEIIDHVGLSRHHTALYYLQLAKVLNPAGASACLSSSFAANVTEPCTDINELKRFLTVCSKFLTSCCALHNVIVNKNNQINKWQCLEQDARKLKQNKKLGKCSM